MFYCHESQHDEPVLMVYEFDVLDDYYDFDEYVCPVCGHSFSLPRWVYAGYDEDAHFEDDES